jgi:hypothetical protein
MLSVISSKHCEVFARSKKVTTAIFLTPIRQLGGLARSAGAILLGSLERLLDILGVFIQTKFAFMLAQPRRESFPRESEH